MTIIDRIYNFYNGLLGKKVSEMLDDPRIDKFVEEGNLKLNNILGYSEVYSKIKQLRTIINDLNVDAKKYQWHGSEDCPLEILEAHYELSQILVGIGASGWNCPFCNTEFQESTMSYKNT